MKTKTLKPLGEILVDEGFVANQFLLDNNRSLQATAADLTEDPWNLPSRLMQFPLEVLKDKDGYHIGLMHPLLAAHPFVKRVAAAIRPHRIEHNLASKWGGAVHARAMWWHAVDLIAPHWKDLLRTRRFTTDDDIVRAVTFALDHRGLDPEEAREILSLIPAPPPQDIWPEVQAIHEPSPVKPDRGAVYWPINHHSEDHIAVAWLRVWGIEAGWFIFSRSNHLNWSERGRTMWHDYRRRQLAAAAEG